jgi:hypothetical protein
MTYLMFMKCNTWIPYETVGLYPTVWNVMTSNSRSLLRFEGELCLNVRMLVERNSVLMLVMLVIALCTLAGMYLQGHIEDQHQHLHDSENFMCHACYSNLLIKLSRQGKVK